MTMYYLSPLLITRLWAINFLTILWNISLPFLSLYLLQNAVSPITESNSLGKNRYICPSHCPGNDIYMRMYYYKAKKNPTKNKNNNNNKTPHKTKDHIFIKNLTSGMLIKNNFHFHEAILFPAASQINKMYSFTLYFLCSTFLNKSKPCFLHLYSYIAVGATGDLAPGKLFTELEPTFSPLAPLPPFCSQNTFHLALDLPKPVILGA